MSCKTCPHFDTCSAPICPEDPGSLKNCAWFPDEAICRREVYSSLLWVRRQHRIARATGRDSERGCFTHPMLAHDCRVFKTIRGLDPETEITDERARKWIKDHPAITEPYRAHLRAQGQKIVAAYGGFGSRGGLRDPSPEGSEPPDAAKGELFPEGPGSLTAEPPDTPIDILEKRP